MCSALGWSLVPELDALNAIRLLAEAHRTARRPDVPAARLAYETYTRVIGYKITHLRNWDLTSAGERDAWAEVAALPRSLQVGQEVADYSEGGWLREGALEF